ncbi:MAG: aldo/keto reductase, partial [Azonexus sp.]
MITLTAPKRFGVWLRKTYAKRFGVWLRKTYANASGLSRKAIMNEIDASLRRLGMDYVDLYQIHR